MPFYNYCIDLFGIIQSFLFKIYQIIKYLNLLDLL